jgi:hypothetical protein
VAVEMILAGSGPIAGSLLIAPSAHRDGPETILELLNEPCRMIPLRCHPEPSMLLLSRQDIVWVKAVPGVEPEPVRPPHYRIKREERARLRLRAGGELEGWLQLELPDDLNRASDFLNGAEEFFPFVTVRGVLLVNKLQVSETRLFESSPLPLGSARDEAFGS